MITLDDISQARAALAGVTLKTPVLDLTQARLKPHLPEAANLTVKLELFQQAGSFKARGAYLGMAGLTEADRSAGVVAASGGNHALAVSWAARAAGVTAQITMPRATDPVRVSGCEAMGARVTLHDDIAAAFAAMEEIADRDGATMMHPFEAPHMILGAATCAAEFLDAVPGMDTLVVPVGGGGLIAGMARAAKLIHPEITVIGVEPIGAQSVTQSLAAGHPVTLDRVDTIADSLGAPKGLPMTFAYHQAHIDRMVQLPDAALLEGMRLYRDALNLVAEPACAAALAAVTGPLRHDLAGQRVGIIACGSNIGPARYDSLLHANTPG